MSPEVAARVSSYLESPREDGVPSGPCPSDCSWWRRWSPGWSPESPGAQRPEDPRTSGRGGRRPGPASPHVCFSVSGRLSPDQSKARAGRWAMRLRGLQGVAQQPVDSGGPGGLGWRLARSRGPPSKRQAFLCAVNLTVVSAEQTCLSSIWEETTSSVEVSGPRLGRACLAGV